MEFRKLSVCLGLHDFERLEYEATLRNLSLSRCVRDCLVEYFSLRDELIPLDGKKRDNEPGKERIIQALLAQTEERIAQTIDVQAQNTDDLAKIVNTLKVMLEKYVFLYLLHTPEVSEAKQDAVLEAARRRFSKWTNAWTQEIG